MGFSWQVYWSGLPFAPPVDHVLSELSTVTRPSCVALHVMAHGFIELLKPLPRDKAAIMKGVAWHAAVHGVAKSRTGRGH